MNFKSAVNPNGEFPTILNSGEMRRKSPNTLDATGRTALKYSR
jgi:hypothetical protein